MSVCAYDIEPLRSNCNLFIAGRAERRGEGESFRSPRREFLAPYRRGPTIADAMSARSEVARGATCVQASSDQCPSRVPAPAVASGYLDPNEW